MPPPHDLTSPSPGRRSLVVGIVGGIASGKSSAARALAGESGIVIDADRIAREVLESAEVVAQIRAHFGEAAVGPDEKPVREVLAERVFANAADRAVLEGFTHPAVRARILAALEAARTAGTSPIVLDVPLLFENDAQHGLLAACDEVVFVDTPDEEREARARDRRGWSAGEVERREAAQWPLEQKRQRATHILRNDGTEHDLAQATQALRRKLGLE